LEASQSYQHTAHSEGEVFKFYRIWFGHLSLEMFLFPESTLRDLDLFEECRVFYSSRKTSVQCLLFES